MFRKPSNLVVLAVVTILVGGIARAADPDLVGWWKLDEGSGTVIADSSNNGIEGTVTGGAWVSPGWHGGGFCLELADDAYVDLGNPASLNFGTGDWSITAWVKNTMTGTGDENKGTIYANGGDNSGGHRYTLAISEVTEGVITLTTDDNATKLQATATTPVNDDEWHFVVGMRSGTSILVYTDGLEEGSNTTVPAGYDLSGTSQHDAYLGAITANDTSSLFKTYDGLIDDVRVFKRALSQAEIDFVMQDIGVTETAYDPVPGDEATDVPRDVVLSWSPGELAVTHDVYLGTAFDDVNDASRGNPMDVLVSQGQSDLAYGPGRLEFGQLYYWRVDEVNGAPDNTVFKGEVWSFAVEPYTYAVENVVVATDAVSDPVSGIENIINGSGLSDDGLHSTDSTDMWQTVTGTAVPFSIQYELDQVYKLDEMLVWNYNVQFESVLGFGLKDVTIEYSADGETWTSLGDIELAQATAQSGYVANNAIDFGGAAVKYVKMTVNSNFGGLPQFGLSEVRFMYIPVAARQPEPADGATDLSLASVLNWRAGREAAVHDVYLGTDAENLELAGSAAEASYDPGTLDLDTTYYWRVDEVNETEAISLWEGPVWRFTTQEFLVVDDFESYTDDEGNRIYESWEDGFLNDTGSTVGYFEAPFAEQTIVNSGGQSMPLFYENAGVSTAEAELSLSQDWTTNGIKSLSLSFYGDPANTGQLYLKINGVRVDYDGAASAIATAAWQAWNIDLATVNTNLRSVTSLTIGIEGSGAEGILYIDDIRLYPKTPEYIIPVEPDGAGLLWWAFDEGSGTVATDSSGSGHDGVISGPEWTAPGALGGSALYFDGTGGIVEDDDAEDYLNGLEAITMAMWVKADAIPTDKGFIIAAPPAGADSFCTVRYDAAGATAGGTAVLKIGLTSTGGEQQLESSNNLQTTEWQHVAVTWSSGQPITLYADGIEDTPTDNYAGMVGTISGCNTLIVGQGGKDAGASWAGMIDEVRIYDRVLSVGEILWLAGQTEPVARPF